MEVGSFSSDVVAMEELMVCSIVEDVVVETLLAAHRSLACLLMVTGSLLKDVIVQPNLIDERFPIDNLHRRNRPGPENKDASDTDNDDEDGDDDDDQDDDDAGDEDFSGEEGGDDDDDEEGDPEEDPAANGNGGSDDDDDEEGDDEEGDEDEEDEEEDEEDEDQPPAKKRK
ncbi:Histidine-rich glycoprotein [Actinidia chinensis var. chinensis]|uniref:Histidine-rich glycoprotein n=1 Tax=Actinidia chinensis var. chinensis TaxID=1590841 RepID=A0A2R6S1K7_ACTCC|nr:Histidine-rich glycoprotein [Actinidia chinensis var. chinensis]